MASRDDEPILPPIESYDDAELMELLTGETIPLPQPGKLAALAAMSSIELEEAFARRESARRFQAAVEIARRARTAQPLPAALHAPEDAFACVVPLLDDAEREHFVVVVLDVRNRPRRVVRVAQGSIDRCLVDPRDVFSPAIREHGTAVLVAHNHPSGDPTPSSEDIALTRRLVQAGAVLGMPVLDHLIVASGPHVRVSRRFVSLAELGVIDSDGREVGASAEIALRTDRPRRRKVVRPKAERTVRSVALTTRRRS